MHLRWRIFLLIQLLLSCLSRRSTKTTFLFLGNQGTNHAKHERGSIFFKSTKWKHCDVCWGNLACYPWQFTAASLAIVFWQGQGYRSPFEIKIRPSWVCFYNKITLDFLQSKGVWNIWPNWFIGDFMGCPFQKSYLFGVFVGRRSFKLIIGSL